MGALQSDTQPPLTLFVSFLIIISTHLTTSTIIISGPRLTRLSILAYYQTLWWVRWLRCARARTRPSVVPFCRWPRWSNSCQSFLRWVKSSEIKIPRLLLQQGPQKIYLIHFLLFITLSAAVSPLSTWLKLGESARVYLSLRRAHPNICEEMRPPDVQEFGSCMSSAKAGVETCVCVCVRCWYQVTPSPPSPQLRRRRQHLHVQVPGGVVLADRRGSGGLVVQSPWPGRERAAQSRTRWLAIKALIAARGIGWMSGWFMHRKWSAVFRQLVMSLDSAGKHTLHGFVSFKRN